MFCRGRHAKNFGWTKSAARGPRSTKCDAIITRNLKQLAVTIM